MLTEVHMKNDVGINKYIDKDHTHRVLLVTMIIVIIENVNSNNDNTDNYIDNHGNAIIRGKTPLLNKTN